MVEEGAVGGVDVAESGRVMVVGRSWFKMGEPPADEPVEGGGVVGRPMGRTKTSPLGVKTPVDTGVMMAPSLFEGAEQPQQSMTDPADDRPAAARSFRFSWPLLGLVFASSLTASAITGVVIWRMRPAPVTVVAALPPPAPASRTTPPPEASRSAATAPAPAPVAQAAPATSGDTPTGVEAVVDARPVQAAPAAPERDAPRSIAQPPSRRARAATTSRRPAAEPTVATQPPPAAPKPAWVDPFAD